MEKKQDPKLVQEAKEIFEDTKTRFRKYFTPKNIVMLLVAAGIVVVAIFCFLNEWIPLEEGTLTWQAKIIMSVAVVAAGVFLSKALDLILVVLLRGSARAITIERMIHSFVKYVIAIIAVIIILVVWFGKEYIAGVLGGVGVLALVIGFGAQKLIGDVIAGVFMVFEGNIAVGDIVTINDWRGTVKEIGIRSTVLEAGNGNIKVFTNSIITEFVNMSKNETLAVVTTYVDYATPVETTEKVLNVGLTSVKSRTPSITDDPQYVGIEEMGDNGYLVKVVAHCHEGERFQAQRDLTREVMLLLQQGNVAIAYPQVDVHTRND